MTRSAGSAALEPMPTIELYDRTRAELAALLATWRFAPVHADRLWNYLYRQDLTAVGAMVDLPVRLRERLLRQASVTRLAAVQATQADDALTDKFLLALNTGQRIETVLMRCRGRTTACLSSQAGCPLGCVFCATGQMGLARNLTTGEIVAQAVHVAAALRAERQPLRNIVLMGMGEPLLNYDAVLRAVEILCDPRGLAIAAKRVTLSTVGVIPGIIRLADEARPISLAVSLHAATQELRLALVPAARTWPLDALLEACRYYVAKLGRKIFFEWTLIEGENDSADQARALAHLLRGLPAQVNLIPLNPSGGYFAPAARAEQVERFQAILRDAGLPTTVRHRRGIEISAGCGQLATAAI
jgi:23S rRNA (adenine2503-C2)-methyltransferase